MSNSEATQVTKCVLHEGSIAHLELNLVSLFIGVPSLLAAFLPAENNCLHLTESFCDLVADGSIRGVGTW